MPVTAITRAGIEGIAHIGGGILCGVMFFCGLARFLVTGRFVLMAGSSALFLVFAEPLWVAFTYRVEDALMPLPSIQVLTQGGKRYARLGPPYRPVSPDELSRDIRRATIAAEDGRFMNHPGLDIWGVARAGVVNIKRSFAARRPVIAQGGSTITMQLVQLSLNRHEKSLLEKLQGKVIEIIVALRIEAELDASMGDTRAKREILTAYLNKVPFGHNITGVGAASESYFGLAPSQLSLGQAAMLMGTIRAPSRFSPFRNPQAAVRERDRVIAQMERFGLLTKSELARLDTKVFVKKAPNLQTAGNGYILQAVDREIRELRLNGQLNSGDWSGQNVRIELSLNSELQQAVEGAARNGIIQLRKRGGFVSSQLDCAVVAIEQTTGRILAVVGGIDFRRHQYDCALQAKRPPGSTFKALAYLAHFENGGSPVHVITGKTNVMTARQAFAVSDNQGAIEIAKLAGWKRIRSLTQRLDIPISAEESEIVFGSHPVSVVKMTAIYAAIANGGEYRNPHLIDEIRIDGKIVFRRGNAPRRIASAEACAKLMFCQREVFASGTGSAYRQEAQQLNLAGKTGTTDGCRDAWFIGSNPEITIGVWVGHRNNKPMPAWVSGANTALPVWVNVMRNTSSR